MSNQLAPKIKMPIGLLGLCLLSTALLLGCSEETISEKWIGHYSYPGSDVKFPLHVDIQIQGRKVKGVAFDGNMEEASVSGSVENGSYSLLLHPLKHGENKSQDVYYRGKRSGNTIVGEWEHVVGAKGAWVSSLTVLGPTEAIKPHKFPCETIQVSNLDECGNGA